MIDGLMINEHIYLFFLILSRYLGMMLLTPIFSSRVILYQIKILVAVSLAVLTFPLVVGNYPAVYPDSNLLVIIEIISEASIGLFMGLAVFLVFSAVQLGGQIVDMRMGFRIANVVDPFSGVDSPVIGQLKNIFVTLIFLALNGHLLLIKHLYQSFEIIPPGRVNFSSELWQYFFRRSADMFLLAVKIALPIAGAIFFIDIILAFLARSVPQMNLFIIGLPIKIMAGLILIFVLMPVLNHYYAEILMDVINEIPALFKLIAP
ncbi:MULTISPECIES: flagellar biosynthetic protein FliR [Halanaerobium]|uniref:Flagellar biosynthetic protein FliR n=1 Tax=Halanaerobium kushneri TaxID=56779 RepID=A0A1N6UB58_9FIRM|nr:MULTISPECIES: flagellar biosynthetic protein FliR [Halanaerobium]PUU89691.1 MAG: flagellar biosynthetic protein FliR [Halanaerobium sp.]PUU94687.1 MAG: flagellar biosynthetic protein FliR [Halanaerobium sp.]RCW60254.1 flagellar biosynthetic protein FliR [Halanaerobium sp. ST460_2HS_T2]SIQ62865.1 flagellar biosynthetic protein FliR [Halanaerobium kushneri]